jgi:hypothetical protein
MGDSASRERISTFPIRMETSPFVKVIHSLSKKFFRQAEQVFSNFKKFEKTYDYARMAQATFSCRFAAIHLETPIPGFFRNYLPSRYLGFLGFSTA